MIVYQFDHEALNILENRNNEDFEFQIKIIDQMAYLPAIHQVRTFFDQNKVYTDVMFYTHADHTYQVIVRKDFYLDFLLILFKYRLLTGLTWEKKD